MKLRFLSLFAFIPSLLLAQVTSDWDGTASGDWDDPDNWHNLTVSGATTGTSSDDTARIGTGSTSAFLTRRLKSMWTPAG